MQLLKSNIILKSSLPLALEQVVWGSEMKITLTSCPLSKTFLCYTWTHLVNLLFKRCKSTKAKEKCWMSSRTGQWLLVTSLKAIMAAQKNKKKCSKQHLLFPIFLFQLLNIQYLIIMIVVILLSVSLFTVYSYTPFQWQMLRLAQTDSVVDF